jgi:hypothetical protein
MQQTSNGKQKLIAFIQSASLLTFVTYVLALYPDVYKRLEAEIKETVTGDSLPTIDQVKSMRYREPLSRCCLNHNTNHSFALNSARNH